MQQQVPDITTQVQDIQTGAPIHNIRVTLSTTSDGGTFEHVAEAYTNQAGKISPQCWQLVANSTSYLDMAKFYLLHFDIASYCKLQFADVHFPEICISLVNKKGKSYFVPVTLDAFGYQTALQVTDKQ